VDKAPDAFRTISEVADDLKLPQHVLRFWETRFVQIKPMKRAGGRRYYRPDDVDLLRGIHHLLYGEGYTIRGVQRILRDQGPKFVQAVWQAGAAQPVQAADEEDDHGSDFEHETAPAVGAEPPEPLLSSPPPPNGRSRGAETRMATAGPVMVGFSGEDFRKLQTALVELRECRKLLDAVLAPP
jgi:DNA-binding transcriptional MerR regulator